MSRIIVVDDESHVLAVLERLFGPEHDVVSETDPQIAWSLIEKQSFDLMITDIRMEPIDGMQLFKHAKEVCPKMPVIMLTGYGTEQSFKEAMELGAFGFMNKPFKLIELRSMATNALERKRASASDASILKDPNTTSSNLLSSQNLVAESPPMQAMRDTIKTLAAKDSPVLICGENGTGKTHVANILHAISSRSEGPLISMNCASLPEPLLDLELFGYTKSAFKASPEGCCGIFEETAKGVVFLKEFTWLSSKLQLKLKDALATKTFRRVKGEDDIPLRSRIIASAIGKPDEIKLELHLEKDLLANMTDWDCITIPPLRERKEDILPLILQFIANENSTPAEQAWRVDTDALQALQDYTWPGNLPELQDFTRKAISACNNNTISLQATAALLAR